MSKPVNQLIAWAVCIAAFFFISYVTLSTLFPEVYP